MLALNLNTAEPGEREGRCSSRRSAAAGHRFIIKRRMERGRSMAKGKITSKQHARTRKRREGRARAAREIRYLSRSIPKGLTKDARWGIRSGVGALGLPCEPGGVLRALRHNWITRSVLPGQLAFS